MYLVLLRLMLLGDFILTPIISTAKVFSNRKTTYIICTNRTRTGHIRTGCWQLYDPVILPLPDTYHKIPRQLYVFCLRKVFV